MTGELYRNRNELSFDFVHADTKRVAAQVKKQVKAVPKKVDGASSWVGAFAIGLTVFFICGLSVASTRGFNFAIGGEVVLSAVVTLIAKKILNRLQCKFGK